MSLGASGSAPNLGASGSNALEPLPPVPNYLSVHSLTKRRKLPKSTGNLHAYMAEDYSQLNWPLPKMFGNEKYGYSLVDVEVKGRKASRDSRFVKECAQNSKKLIRLAYDQQIVDTEWRNTYKALLRAENHQATLPGNATEKTKKICKEDVEARMKYLLELQEQKDMYEEQIKTVYKGCDSIKETIRKEAELDELREFMEGQTRNKISTDSPFWMTKFNVHSQQGLHKK